MTRSQNLPEECLPPAEWLPTFVYPLPELHYPRRFNAASELLDRALERGFAERPAYYFEGQALSYRNIARQVNRLGNALRAKGIAPGDRVMLRLGDQPELIVAILALLKIGAIAVPTYPMLRAEHLVYRERDTEAKALLVSADLLAEVEKARPNFAFVKTLVAAPGVRDSRYLSYDDLLARGAEDLAPAPTFRDDIGFIIYTSGSTGDPKGVLWSHGDVVAQADTYGRMCLKPEPDDVFMGPPPVPFAAGLLYFLICPLRFGASALLIKEKTPDKILEGFVRYRGTVFIAMATYYNMLLKEAGSKLRKGFAAARQTLVGGEPVAPELSESWFNETGCRLAQFLGTTEMSNVFLSSRWRMDPYRPASAGKPVPGYHVVVRDAETFDEVERGEAGMLTVIGPTGTKYWRRPDEQKKAVRRGWNVCQDLVKMDEENFIYHLGRADDIIVSAGYNISPVEVETVLLKHPAVAEAACVAASDPAGLRSSIVRACVVPRSGIAPTPALAKELQEFFKARGAPYMYPREIIFLDELPKTLTGKISRSALRRLEP